MNATDKLNTLLSNPDRRSVDGHPVITLTGGTRLEVIRRRFLGPLGHLARFEVNRDHGLTCSAFGHAADLDGIVELCRSLNRF